MKAILDINNFRMRCIGIYTRQSDLRTTVTTRARKAEDERSDKIEIQRLAPGRSTRIAPPRARFDDANNRFDGKPATVYDAERPSDTGFR